MQYHADAEEELAVARKVRRDAAKIVRKKLKKYGARNITQMKEKLAESSKKLKERAARVDILRPSAAELQRIPVKDHEESDIECYDCLFCYEMGIFAEVVGFHSSSGGLLLDRAWALTLTSAPFSASYPENLTMYMGPTALYRIKFRSYKARVAESCGRMLDVKFLRMLKKEDYWAEMEQPCPSSPEGSEGEDAASGSDSDAS
ncbi:unnamed protein product [Polarella glacialis]|uniref:Uncharacterized protein n=1 Tax=Polarella glacialis TaxID=89957 RepID=A0A813L1C8_POLGL|nr:unnamed protein product [Polarella glacialis]CAE8714318.1 unnamed protein product [Polarella glacialis]